MLKRFLFKLYLFHRGIRFYRTGTVPGTLQFKTAVFQTVNGRQVEFHFYKEQCEDLIYKHGIIRREKFIGYVIQAKLDQTLPANLVNYNNLKFFFNSRNWLFKNDDFICETLLNIFLDFLKADLEQSK